MASGEKKPSRQDWKSLVRTYETEVDFGARNLTLRVDPNLQGDQVVLVPS
jgi:hypothetical protein